MNRFSLLLRCHDNTNSSPSAPAHFFVRDDFSTRIALVFVRSKWAKWIWFHFVHFDLTMTRAILVETSSDKKCAGAEGEELVLDYLWVYEHCLSSRGKIAVGRMPSNEGWEQIECTVKNVNQVTWATFTCPLLALYLVVTCSAEIKLRKSGFLATKSSVLELFWIICRSELGPRTWWLCFSRPISHSKPSITLLCFFLLFFFVFISFSFLFLFCLLCPILLIDRNAARQVHVYWFTFSAIICVSEVWSPPFGTEGKPRAFLFGYQTCACHEGVATELFTTRRVSRSYPSLSSDGDPCSRFAFQRIAPTLAETNNFQLRAPLPWLAPDLQVHRSDTWCHRPCSRTLRQPGLRVRFQDRWSTSHYRTRVSASSSSVVHHFPGTKVQDTVLPSPSFQIADRWTSFSRILVWFCGFYSQYFLNTKRERKTTRRTRENDAGITRPSDFKKKVGHTGTGTTVLPDKIVLRSHARPKDDVEARKGKLCWEIQSISLILFHRSSLCWNERLSFAGPAKYIIDPLTAPSTGSLDSRGIGLHVTGNINKASVVDAEIRAAQSKRERNATREPILWRTSRR